MVQKFSMETVSNMAKVIAQADAVVSLQGTIIRSRVPTAILLAAGASEGGGDAIQYKVLDDGRIVGQVIQGGAAEVQANRQPPTPPKRVAATQKSVAQKAAAKKLAPKTAPRTLRAPSVDDAFGDDDEDDSPLLPVPAGAPRVAPAVRKTAPAVVAPRAAAPRGPIPKPSQAKRKGNAVRYEIPE